MEPADEVRLCGMLNDFWEDAQLPWPHTEPHWGETVYLHAEQLWTGIYVESQLVQAPENALALPQQGNRESYEGQLNCKNLLFNTFK